MPELKSNLVNRINMLPIPSDGPKSLLPIFEAVSNSYNAIEELKNQDTKNNEIKIEINPLASNGYVVRVVDDGIGLNDKNYEAFCKTDTDNKKNKGGKGVGRLLWLQAFRNIKVSSVYKISNNIFNKREFTFVLNNEEQIQQYQETVAKSSAVGTDIIFKKFNSIELENSFVKIGEKIAKCFISHFFPNLIEEDTPSVKLQYSDKEYNLKPLALSYIKEREDKVINSEEFGKINISMTKCYKNIRYDTAAKHHIHLMAHKRNVTTRKIDSLLGLGYLNDEQNLVLQICVSGEYLNDVVTQERTEFAIQEKHIKQLIKICCDYVKREFAQEEVKKMNEERINFIKEIYKEFPIFNIGNPEDIISDKIRLGIPKKEDIFRDLSVHVFRERKEQDEGLHNLVNTVPIQKEMLLSEKAKRVSKNVKERAESALELYVKERKNVLDFLEVSIIRKDLQENKSSSYVNEDIIHNFLCPMRYKSGFENIEPKKHNLWIIDEHLTLAEYFSSDVPFSKIQPNVKDKQRPDIAVYDRLYALSERDARDKVLIIEFKKPGLQDYKNRNPVTQIYEYIKQFRRGGIINYEGHKENLKNSFFQCYIIADLIGDMEGFVDGWPETYNGESRIFYPAGPPELNNTVIQVIPWKTLFDNAKTRNLPFIKKLTETI